MERADDGGPLVPKELMERLRAREGLFVLLLAAALVAGTACPSRELRGRVDPSPDGKTYLIIDDDDGCDAVLVDGKPWRHPLHMSGEIAPGPHVVDCGDAPAGNDDEKPDSGIRITIPEKTTFRFDYWGT